MHLAPHGAGASHGSVLFVEPTFLSHRPHKKVRGVGVFALLLIDQLTAAGVSVTVPAEGSWRPRLSERLPRALGARSPRIVYTPNLRLRRPLINSVIAAGQAAGDRYDVLLLNNVSSGLIPLIRWLWAIGRFRRVVVLANQWPKARFVRALRGVPTDVLAVNGEIAAQFAGKVTGRVTAHYGIADAEMFFPPAMPPSDGLVHFVMLGKMDDPLKGAAAATRAFVAMPIAVRERCRLHLLGYERPPGSSPPGVVEHPFMAYERVPEFLRGMSVYVTASARETFCQAIVQAMLTGLPCLAPALPVFEEKLDAGGGIIFRGEGELAREMERLATDTALRVRLGAEARRTALERYVWDTRAFVREWLFPG